MTMTTMLDDWEREGAALSPRPPDYIVGVDAGQIRDYSAVVVLERRERLVASVPAPGPPSFIEKLGLAPRPTGPTEAIYRARHLERLPLESSYPEQVRHVVNLLRRLRDQMDTKRPGRLCLALDATGVGVAVSDLFQEADLAGADFIPIVIHGGDAVTPGQHGGYRVPKRALVSTVQVCLQTRRLQIAASLPAAPTLMQEFRSFRAKITATGHDQYGADDWREREHDDIILALACGLWVGEQVLPGVAGLAEAFAAAANWQSGG
jgi:hypothetical protein